MEGNCSVETGDANPSLGSYGSEAAKLAKLSSLTRSYTLIINIDGSNILYVLEISY